MNLQVLDCIVIKDIAASKCVSITTSIKSIIRIWEHSMGSSYEINTVPTIPTILGFLPLNIRARSNQNGTAFTFLSITLTKLSPI